MRDRTATALGLLLFLLVVASCATEANALEGTVEARNQIATGPTQVLDMPERLVNDLQIVVTNPGAEPRELLTLAGAEGTIQKMSIVQGGTQSFWLGEPTDSQPYPDLRLQVNLEVLAVDGDTRFVQVEVGEAEASSRQADVVSDTHSKALMNGFGGTSVITTTPQGQITGTEPMIGIGQAGEVLALGHIERGFLSMADPLPAEPVGPGAVWEVRTSSTSGGFPVTIVRRYTLASVDDTEISALVERSVVFAPGSYEQADILVGSQLIGKGSARWMRGGIIGIVNYDVDGTVRYGLPQNTQLEQRINRAVRTVINQLSVPVVEEPPSPEEPEAPVIEQPAEPDEETPADDEPEPEVQAEDDDPADPVQDGGDEPADPVEDGDDG